MYQTEPVPDQGLAFFLVYNTPMICLPAEFYLRPTPQVARDLLGMRLVREIDGQRICGRIIETEAYDGEEDQACHARFGKTERNAAMFGLPGRAYIYFTYGMHWCLNVVTGAEGTPAAVLIRALQPLEGLERIARNRSAVEEKHWVDGPAKLCKALEIDGSLYGISLVSGESSLRIEQDAPIAEDDVIISPRVGIQYAPEPWLSMPWRFRVNQR